MSQDLSGRPTGRLGDDHHPERSSQTPVQLWVRDCQPQQVWQHFGQRGARGAPADQNAAHAQLFSQSAPCRQAGMSASAHTAESDTYWWQWRRCRSGLLAGLPGQHLLIDAPCRKAGRSDRLQQACRRHWASRTGLRETRWNSGSTGLPRAVSEVWYGPRKCCQSSAATRKHRTLRHRQVCAPSALTAGHQIFRPSQQLV